MQSTPLRRERRARQGYSPLLFVTWGLLLWLGAVATFRLAGDWFLLPGDLARLAAAYYGAVPVIAAVTLPLYYLRRLDSDTRLRAAVLIALPGMMLHMVTAPVLNRVFANLPAEATGPFASWLFWAYGLILLSGFVSSGRRG